MTVPRDPTEWVRVGRGRELQFFATDDEVVAFLTIALAHAKGTFGLVGTRVDPQTRTASRKLLKCRPDELVTCSRLYDGHIAWLWALGETSIDEWKSDQLQAFASVNGLVSIEHGFTRAGRREASRIAVVDRVRSLHTGVVEANASYVAVFRGLERTIRRQLTWSTKRRMRVGEEIEDARVALMTDAAASAAVRYPDEWAVIPGRRIDVTEP